MAPLRSLGFISLTVPKEGIPMRFITVIVSLLLANLLFVGTLAAADNSGLWHATVMVSRVSEVNTRIQDSSFDLGVTAVQAETQVDLIGIKAAGWKYLDTATADPAVNWNTLAFPDSGWPGGTAPLGFGRGDATSTTVANRPSVYYRHTVSVTDPAEYSALNLRLLRDDAAVVYLNGKEILRSNLPTGTITFNSVPEQIIGPVDGDRYLTATVPLAAGDLLAGDNVFAVEVHQHPSELAAATTLGALTPTSADFPLRLLFHVDATGTVRLLKEALIMKDSADSVVVLADSALASGYSGVALRGDTLVGLRTSAIGYDFTGATTTCSGAMGISSTTDCSFTLPAVHPTNPFLHRFHPDHDNLDEQFATELQGGSAESYDIARTIKLIFSSRYPANPDEPERPTASKPLGWGATQFGGVFTETITGLHSKTLSVSGWFTIKRITSTTELKQ